MGKDVRRDAVLEVLKVAATLGDSQSRDLARLAQSLLRDQKMNQRST